MNNCLLQSHYFDSIHFLECGPSDGPLMFFLHGWPAIGLMWRRQINEFSKQGWRCIAPDLRGYGKSSVPESSAAYSIENSVTDMVRLHDHVGGTPAVWVGHDWGSVVAAQLAAHAEWRCKALVLISLAYLPDANALPTLVPLVDRNIYPEKEYPDGQWDYYRYYNTHFDSAVADLDYDKYATLTSIYRAGNPDASGMISPNAIITRNGGRFGSAHRAPPVEKEQDLWPQADFETLVHSFSVNGFRSACSWYLNDSANILYARQSSDRGCLKLPVLFINGLWDQMCNIDGNRLGEPMCDACTDLTIINLPAGHWLPLEKKQEVNEAISLWLISKK